MSAHRIVVVGAGGREHALARRLARDRDVDHVIVAPGNDGMARAHHVLAAPPSDADAFADACRAAGVTLVVIGPEAPLADGLADRLRERGLAVYGPSAAAARLESSKWFAKQVMADAGVPTARAGVFEAPEPAVEVLHALDPPWVLKADGLAAGKGVLVTTSREEAERFLAGCFAGSSFGHAGRRVVIEEFLGGEEASLMAVCDGERFVLLPPARDYKRALDADRGPNTGGMGAFAPAPHVDANLEREVGDRIVAPVLRRMATLGAPFVGTLYVGLMMGPGGPRVVEFNARFGDPETQVVLPLVDGSLAGLLAGAAAGALDPARVTRAAGAAVAVAIVAEGYPERPVPGGRIEGLDRLMSRDDLHVFHAGLAWEGAWVVRGGRAAHVVARAATVEDARRRVYEAIDTLGGSGWRCRRDVAAAAAEPAGCSARGGDA